MNIHSTTEDRVFPQIWDRFVVVEDEQEKLVVDLRTFGLQKSQILKRLIDVIIKRLLADLLGTLVSL
jgi:hypothetical protein